MPISADILNRRATHFVLWSPRPQNQPPRLVLGRLQPGNPPTVEGIQHIALTLAADAADLFEIAAASCGLDDGVVYHYWFELDDSRSALHPPARVVVTDPFATCVDWRVSPPGVSENKQPAAVIRYLGQGKLADSDPGGETATFEMPDVPAKLPPNNQVVIYELPTAWALSRSLNEPERAVATFLDVAALIDEQIGGANFADLSLVDVGKSYLTDLGVNALELLPRPTASLNGSGATTLPTISPRIANSVTPRGTSRRPLTRIWPVSSMLVSRKVCGSSSTPSWPSPRRSRTTISTRPTFASMIRGLTRTTPIRRLPAAQMATVSRATALAARCGGTPSR